MMKGYRLYPDRKKRKRKVRKIWSRKMEVGINEKRRSLNMNHWGKEGKWRRVPAWALPIPKRRAGPGSNGVVARRGTMGL